MTNNVSHPSANPEKSSEGASKPSDQTKPMEKNLPHEKAGAHEKEQGEEIKSRSADPGQSSYGGFANEDTRRQAQDLEGKGEKGSGKP